MPNTAGATNRTDPKRTSIAVNGSGGAYVLISATQCDGYVEIIEQPDQATYTGSFTAQGCTYQRADENYAITYTLQPSQIFQIGDAIQKNRSEGVPAMTLPNGEARPATPFIKIRSATATATNVYLSEWRQR